MKRALSWLTLFTVFLSACAPGLLPGATGASSPSTSGERDDRSILRVGVTGLIANPTPQSSSSNLYQFWPLYDNLTQFAANYEVRPSVADRWELAADGKTWTFTIRSDIKWPDGAALTAEDVAFTLNTVIEKNWPQKAFFATTTGARVVNPTTVEIATSQQDMSVPNGGPYLWVLQKKYFEEVGFDGYVRKPVGSGPYELVEFKASSSLHFRKRATTHAFRKTSAEEIVFTAIPDNGQIIAGLRGGELDIAAQVNFSGDQIDQLKNLGMNVVINLASIQSMVFPQGSYESRNLPLKDKRVRLALNYAVDKETIARSIFKGYAEPASQIAVPGSAYYDPDAKPYPYDPALAKQLLAEAGYPNGFRLPRGMDITPGMTLPDVALAVQAYLKAVGVDFEITQNELGVFVDKAYGRNNQSKSDIWSSGTGDGNGFITQARVFYGCGKPAGGAADSTWYCNPEWDRLMDAAYAERDAQRRRDLMRQANRLQRDDAVAIFFLAQPVYVVHSPKVRGIQVAMPLQYNFDSANKAR